jgi:uncharacterized membrane protein
MLHRLVSALPTRLLLPPLAGTLGVAALATDIHRRSGYDSHRFLLFNLLLAWVPMLAALLVYALRRRRWALAPAVVWLVFLPNAPYVVTDLVHYGQLNSHIPAWLDLLTLLAAAGSGLLLGLGSLLLIQLAFRRSWLVVAFTVPLASFGVYLGRVLRLNSWDALHPGRLLGAVGPRLTAPEAHPLMLLGVGTLSLLLALSYVAFYHLAAARPVADQT